MAQGAVTAQVSGRAREIKELMRDIYRESAQRTVERMQQTQKMGGNLRFDTGFLRASLVAASEVALPPLTYKPEGQDRFAYDAGPINLVINAAKITDPVVVVYTANYARPREYGARGQPGDRWVALAAQTWPQIVNEVAAELRAGR